MWYFAWILGLPLAAIFAVMNAMWLEMLPYPPAVVSPSQPCYHFTITWRTTV
jgi:cyd operon protein YbgT